jgi:hypothetical protein
VSDWDHAPCCQGQPHDDEQPAVCLGCDQDFPCQAEQMRAERDRLRSALDFITTYADSALSGRGA